MVKQIFILIALTCQGVLAQKIVQNLDSCSFDFTSYQRLDKIYEYIDCLDKKIPQLVRVCKIGKSVENRPIPLVKVNDDGNLPIVFIEAGIHAREWISPATALYLLRTLMKPHSQNIMEKFTWYIVPVINPDGYEFSHTDDRMWRKNRALTSNESCMGVDLNRNWDAHWGTGASHNPCSEVFQGSKPFSEPESRALRRAISKAVKRLKIYLSFHSYGQKLLYPYGWSTNQLPRNELQLHEKGEALAKLFQKIGGHEYVVGPSAETQYLASGSVDDWLYSLGVSPLAYTLELPDQGKYGFVLPPEEIIPVGKEISQGLIAFLEENRKFAKGRNIFRRKKMKFTD